MARLLRTITTRLTAPPLALKAHAVLVLTASFVVADTARPGWWASPALVAILLWPLLRGSRFVWWVQLVGLGFVLIGATSVRGSVFDGPPGFSVFFETELFVAAVVLLAGAWSLLLAPSVRGYCVEYPARRNVFVFAIGVYIVASFPALALGLDQRIPSSSQVDDTPGAAFIASDPGGPVALYLADQRDRICLVGVTPTSSSRSCGDAERVGKHPHPIHAGDVIADVVPEEIERVEVRMTSSEVRTATLIESKRTEVDVYYLLDAPWQAIDVVVGYDGAGEAAYRAEENY